MKSNYVCPRCGNKDERYIGYINGKPYCRKCINFNGHRAKDTHIVSSNTKLFLDYELSKDQNEISTKTYEAISNNKNVLIYAVTGAGKTELVYKSIEHILKIGGNVGFAIPRRDVVIDLYPRIKDAFKNNSVTLVYGGNSKVLESDIVLLTTHQLYRYEHYFDLLIVDEIDAFPFKNDDTLMHFLKSSLRGNYIFLTATPTKEDIKNIKKDNGVVLTLFSRYHRHPLPEPIFIKPELNLYLTCKNELKSLLKEHKQVFIFVPTIKIGESLFRFLSFFFKGGKEVDSTKEDRNKIVKDFKDKKLNYLVTTAILERGVTVRDLQVIVFKSDHPLYTKEMLIQIAGRVGRKKDCPDGKVIFIGEHYNETNRNAIEEIKRINKKANL